MNKALRTGDWIFTQSGIRFYPLDPRAEEVDLEDIASSLSKICRWNGHTREFYSVAQHAVTVAELVENLAPDLALAALHHDSAEAYLSDITRPVKKMLGKMILDMEANIRQVIMGSFAIKNPQENEWHIQRQEY